MTPERWERIDRVWQAVLARPEPERAAAVAELSDGDETLQRDVESLLSHLTWASAAGFGDAPVAVVVPQASLVNRRIGPYTVQTLLGAGGMGEVYRAHDSTLGRDVAIKILLEPWLADPERRARFEREAKLLALLNHHNVGAIYGVHESDGVRALVLELVEGETLAERIARQAERPEGRRGLPIDEVLAIARQLTDALEAAHERGIVHRDLKPANIKITPDMRAKVLDFGLARALTGGDSGSDTSALSKLAATRTGRLVGTAAYMSPEQARGRTVDKRTDIWAFGCVLYEMLTGKQVFGGADIAETLANVIGAEPDWRALPADTPPALRICLRRCLQRNLDERIRDIADARLAMEGAFDATGDDFAERQRALRSRLLTTYAGWIVAAVVTVAAIAVILVVKPSSPDAPGAVAATTPPVLVKPKIGGGGTATTRTIQQAIDLAARGATVSVLPGTYPEALVIKRGLTLEATGERSGPVLIAPPGTPETAIEIATFDPVIIRGLTVHASGGTAIRAIGEVDLTVERTNVLAVNPPSEVRALILVSNDERKSNARAKAAIRQNVIDGGIDALPRGVARPQNIGVQLVGDLDGVIEGNRIRRTGAICVVIDPREDFGGRTNVEILSNDIDDCHPAGRVSAIKVGSPSVALLSPRLPVTATGSVNIIGNTIRNSSQDCLNAAISFDAFAGRIERNRIVNFVQPCASANPRNLPAAIWLGLRPSITVPAVTPVVRFNDIQGNAQAGLRIAPNQTISTDASCNYWGSAKGPSGIGPGDGDAIVVETGAPQPIFLPFAKSPIARTSSPAC
jgi:tRNA A-37 threonylcarbamoyl transferase component Bud32